jgi:ribosomal protein L3 glutamine methyltransferase
VTLMQAIELAAARLQEAGACFGHGTENAFDEAAWLVLWRVGLPLDDLDSVAAQALDADQQAAVQMLVDQRIATRQPAAYLTHEAWLQGVPFYVDSRAIVPRSLIAELIDDGTLDAWLGAHTRNVLDLCTGNGSLAVLAARAWPEVRIDASDVSAAALAVARINIERHELDDRITLHEADGLQGLPRRYDLILCNPPYVNSASFGSC